MMVKFLLLIHCNKLILMLHLSRTSYKKLIKCAKSILIALIEREEGSNNVTNVIPYLLYIG